MVWFGPEATLTITESPEELTFTSTRQLRGVDFIGPALCALGAILALFTKNWFWAAGLLVMGGSYFISRTGASSHKLRVTQSGFNPGDTFFGWRSVRGIEYYSGGRYAPQCLRAMQGQWTGIPILLYVNQAQCQTVIETIKSRFPNIEFDTSNDGLGKMLHEVVDLIHPPKSS